MTERDIMSLAIQRRVIIALNGKMIYPDWAEKVAKEIGDDVADNVFKCVGYDSETSVPLYRIPIHHAKY